MGFNGYSEYNKAPKEYNSKVNEKLESINIDIPLAEQKKIFKNGIGKCIKYNLENIKKEKYMVDTIPNFDIFIKQAEHCISEKAEWIDIEKITFLINNILLKHALKEKLNKDIYIDNVCFFILLRDLLNLFSTLTKEFFKCR